MAFPNGVETATCTAGADLSFLGQDEGITATLEVILGGKATHIVWEATGQPFDAFTEKLEADAGDPLTFVVPLVDQAGFIAPNGAAITFWAYRLTVTARRGLEDIVRVKNFQVVTGQTNVDIDLIPDGPILGPLLAPTVPVTFDNLIDAIEDPDSDLSDALETAVLEYPVSTATQEALDELDAAKAAVVHTHPTSQVTGLDGILAAKADLVAGVVPANQLPSYVDDVLEFPTLLEFPNPGATGKIYVALDTNLTYRWTGSTYGALDPSLALGETSQSAYRGDHGKTAYDHSQTTGNPHGSTAAQIPSTPAGGLAATTVQAALNELDTEKQVASAMLAKLSALAATLTDGQLIKWDATLGEPVAVNPVGAGRIASVRNVTGVVTALAPGGAGGAGAIQTIASTAFSVTNSAGRPVAIKFGASFSQTVAGTGAVFLVLRETTAASAADRKLCVQPLTGVATVGNQYVTAADEWDLGVVTTTRTFELRAYIFSPSGQTPQVSIFNSLTAPSWAIADAA